MTRVGTLAKDESYAAGLDFTVPRDAAGQRYFIVKTDAFTAVYELGRTDNNVVVATDATLVKAEPKPNLLIEGVSALANWRVGQTVQLSYTVRNAGNDAISGFFGEEIRLVDTLGLAPTQVLTSTWAFQTLAAGGALRAKPDPGRARHPTGQLAPGDRRRQGQLRRRVQRGGQRGDHGGRRRHRARTSSLAAWPPPACCRAAKPSR